MTPKLKERKMKVEAWIVSHPWSIPYIALVVTVSLIIQIVCR